MVRYALALATPKAVETSQVYNPSSSSDMLAKFKIPGAGVSTVDSYQKIQNAMHAKLTNQNTYKYTYNYKLKS